MQSLPTTDILPLIPQRPPFVLIDELVRCSESETVTRFTIRADGVLVDGDFLSESGLIENMAQTAAAGACRRVADNEMTGAPVGYIGALKSVRVASLPSVGDTIETRTAVLHNIGPAIVVRATTFNAAGEELAGCEMKIFAAR